jgi:uncharacterized protein (TIGR02452 family)
MEPALAGTSFHEAMSGVSTQICRKQPATIEVSAESTVEAIVRLHREGSGHLAALNFASARNPGGGFLGGAQAQEESLTRSSGLYPCLLRQPQFYERHRSSQCLLYQDLAIFSPGVPFFVNDDGGFLDEPALASVITSPAPNTGALANNDPAKLPLASQTLRRRAEFVLRLAAAKNVDTLILGAWGCGVFRNDPAVVAEAFAKLLLDSGPFATSFARVVFAIYDRSPTAVVLKEFSSRLGGR